MSLQLIQELLFKMLFKIFYLVKIITFLAFTTNIAKAEKLIFDVSNSKITLGNKKKENDFTIYGFSDSKRTLVLKITGPKQKVILQKKKKIGILEPFGVQAAGTRSARCGRVEAAAPAAAATSAQSAQTSIAPHPLLKFSLRES